MVCRPILLRILEAAHKEGLTPPIRIARWRPPSRASTRTGLRDISATDPHPEEFGHLLAGCRPFYCDHFLIQVGTGLRSGELLGLRRRRVFPELGRIEVIEAL